MGRAAVVAWRNVAVASSWDVRRDRAGDVAVAFCLGLADDEGGEVFTRRSDVGGIPPSEGEPPGRLEGRGDRYRRAWGRAP